MFMTFSKNMAVFLECWGSSRSCCKVGWLSSMVVVVLVVVDDVADVVSISFCSFNNVERCCWYNVHSSMIWWIVSSCPFEQGQVVFMLVEVVVWLHRSVVERSIVCPDRNWVSSVDCCVVSSSWSFLMCCGVGR